ALPADNRAYAPMDIGVTYRLEKTAAGVRAVRHGELKIDPPHRVAGQPLSSRQTSLRALLKRHLGDVFPERLEAGAIALPEPLNKAGKLVPANARSAAGWLTISMQLE